jgi:hypothetical protein
LVLVVRDWDKARREGRSAGLRMAGFALSLSIVKVVDVVFGESLCCGCMWLLNVSVLRCDT